MPMRLARFAPAVLCCALLAACAKSANQDRAADALEWLRLNESQCVAKGGQLLAIHNKDPHRAIEVWLDRWYMGVKTGDRGHHRLAPGTTDLPLGCSFTDGAEQRWELVEAKFLPD